MKIYKYNIIGYRFNYFKTFIGHIVMIGGEFSNLNYVMNRITFFDYINSLSSDVKYDKNGQIIIQRKYYYPYIFKLNKW